VRDYRMMLKQNGMFRHAAGVDLLIGILKDPAMPYLDNARTSRSIRTRTSVELLELFTMAGHYTERDVREAARPSPDGPTTLVFKLDADQHDAAENLLGRTDPQRRGHPDTIPERPSASSSPQILPVFRA
jgi:uncharacterized protein (DUF1800 family)